MKETVDLVTFTAEILTGKLHFLCSALEMMETLNVAKLFKNLASTFC